MLRLLEKNDPYLEEGELWNSPDGAHHAMHFAIPYPESFRPQLVRYLVDRYSRPGDIVMDPFCGRGTTPLETIIRGRIPYASDVDPLAVRISQAKLAPVGLGDVVQLLQLIDLGRPASLGLYREFFEPFYHVGTYRELVNLRAFLASQSSPVAKFVELVALSLLHGHTAGYFSGYTFPQIALSPDAQRRLNDKRRHEIEYRPVVPRLIRKAALMLRDGAALSSGKLLERSKSVCADVRNLNSIRTGIVNLVIGAPPRPFSRGMQNDLWLRYWFANLTDTIPLPVMSNAFDAQNIDDWADFMNESLVELARVVIPGGRVIFDLREIKNGDEFVKLDQVLAGVVAESLGAFWEIEGLLIHTPKFARVKDAMRERGDGLTCKKNRLLVLRRK